MKDIRSIVLVRIKLKPFYFYVKIIYVILLKCHFLVVL